MNYLGGVHSAYEQFKADLQNDEDYKEFKTDAVRKIYVDKFSFGATKTIYYWDSNKRIRVVEDFKILSSRVEQIINYGVPEVNTKETRKLNRDLLK